jgi:hypothetical protein
MVCQYSYENLAFSTALIKGGAGYTGFVNALSFFPSFLNPSRSLRALLIVYEGFYESVSASKGVYYVS